MLRARCLVWVRMSALLLPAASIRAANMTVDSISPTPAFNIKEEVLAEKSAATKAEDRKEDTASPDGTRVAWREKSGDKWVVKLNGVRQGGEFDEVKWILFSPDSSRLAFFGRRGKMWTAVVDGRDEPGKYGEVRSLVFSKDGAHIAYAAKKDGKERIVKDGLDGAVFDDVSHPNFSPKGDHLVYAAKRQKAWVIVDNGVVDDRELKDGYRFGGFTPHGETPIFVGYGDHGIRIIIGDYEGPFFDAVALPVRFGKTDHDFAYAGAHFKNPALKAQRAMGRVVLGKDQGPEYEAAPVESTAMAWLRAAGGGVMFLQPGVHYGFQARWHGISSPEWSPDGENIAYAARRGDKDYVVVLNGEEGPSFEQVPCGPFFSPQGNLYYAAFDTGKMVVVVDGTRRNEFTWETDSWKSSNSCGKPAFFDGGHFAYMTEEGGEQFQQGQTSQAKRRFVIDGQPGKEYDAKGFSPLKGRIVGGELHTLYEVYADGGHHDASFVVLDAHEAKLHDDIFAGTSRLLEDGSATYLARDGRKFVRVTVTAPVAGTPKSQ